MPKLPDFTPQATWEPAPPTFVPANYMSVFPKIKPLPDGRKIIDQCQQPDGSFEVRVFEDRDHPNLAALPEHTPRVVKALFRREWQLRYLRMTDASGVLRDLDAAFAAWDLFHARKAA